MATVQIQKEILEAIIRHAEDEAPRECCGLLVGQDEIITHHQPMKNILESTVRYAMGARELFQFFKNLRATNQKHLGIYHSHPLSDAYPSETDIRESFYPDCAYFIVSLKDPRAPLVRAFRLIGNEAEELVITGID